MGTASGAEGDGVGGGTELDEIKAGDVSFREGERDSSVGNDDSSLFERGCAIRSITSLEDHCKNQSYSLHAGSSAKTLLVL